MIINNENYVDKAEAAIGELVNKKDDRGRKIDMVTVSQIRNILAMAAELYNEVLLFEGEELNSEIKGRIDYLRVRVIYEAGRESSTGRNKKAVRDFVTAAKIIEILKEIKTKSDYILFYRYFESLVAFHKFNNGRD